MSREDRAAAALGRANRIADELLRELLARRLGDDQATPREEAATYVREILKRGVAVREIAERCGVGANAVSNWRLGKCAPVSARRMQRLAAMTREVLQLPVVPPRQWSAPTPITQLVAELARVRRTSIRRLVRDDLRMKSGPWLYQRWMRGEGQPGRQATTRIRALARQCGLPEPLLAVCDARLAQIRETERRRGVQFSAFLRARPGKQTDTFAAAALSPPPMEETPMTSNCSPTHADRTGPRVAS